MIYAFVFAYIPMGGIIVAFQKYSPRKGILGSEWVGLKYFKQFFTTPSSRKIIFNTLYLGIYSLIAGFPIPILLAILLNEMRSKKYKKFIQMVTYAPYFISTVVMVGMMMRMMDMRTGIINRALQSIGIGPINFFGEVNLFPSLYVWSGIWQGAGYSSIIYIAALAGVSPELQEAAIVDGANRFQQMLHITLPGLVPTIMILFILRMGNILNVGYEKILLLYNSATYATADVISTYTYRLSFGGSGNPMYSKSTAIGLFNTIINVCFLMLTNLISKKATDAGLF